MPLRPNERHHRYKAPVDAEEGRRRRDRDVVQIRKNRREESLRKKRREPLQANQEVPVPDETATDIQRELENLPTMIAGIWTNDTSRQLEATIWIRNSLSLERSPPIEEVIQSGVVRRLVEFLTREDLPQLQFEAAWALKNIASGKSEHTRVVIDHGAVPIFMSLLGCPSAAIREQAVRALGHIAGFSSELRDRMLQDGALSLLLPQLNEHASLSMIRSATWTLSNFCRGEPQPGIEQIRSALPYLAQLVHSTDEEIIIDACWALSHLSEGTNDNIEAVIGSGVCPHLIDLLQHRSPSVVIPALRTVGNIATGNKMQTQIRFALPSLTQLVHSTHEEIIIDACWALSHLSEGTNDNIEAVIGSGLCPRLIDLLQHRSPSVVIPALRTVGNIATGNEMQTQYIIDLNALPVLLELLTGNYDRSIKQEACWIISNITAGNSQQIQSVIEANLISPLVSSLQNAVFEVKKEAAWAVYNATSGCTPEQMKYLVSSQQYLSHLCSMLQLSDPEIVAVCLNGLKRILKAGEAEKNSGQNGGKNPYARMIAKIDGFDKIELLLNHGNNVIRDKVIQLLAIYYDALEESDDEVGPLSDSSQQGFHFGGENTSIPPGGFSFN